VLKVTEVMPNEYRIGLFSVSSLGKGLWGFMNERGRGYGGNGMRGRYTGSLREVLGHMDGLLSEMSGGVRTRELMELMIFIKGRYGVGD